MQFSIAQPRFDQFNVLLGRRDALLRFLLEGMKHVDDACKPYGINGPVRIAVEILDQLKHSTTAESSERLCRYWLPAFLHLVQGEADTVLHLGRESPQVFSNSSR